MKDIRNMLIPMIVEQDSKGERSWDLFSRLLKDRIIFLGSAIDDSVSNVIVAELLYLQSEDPKKDIHFYINSPGGSVTAGFGIYDTMQMVSCDVRTYCVGQCASMGAFLLSAGTPGKRFALPSSRIMIHQPSGGADGMCSDIQIQAEEILRLKKYLNDILAKNTKQSLSTIEKDTDRDFFMSADEAVKYGLVDSVMIKKRK